VVVSDAESSATADEFLEAGAKLARYEIRERLGSGGMGVVYSAWDPQLDRTVAIKILRHSTNREDSLDARARLLREAQALARLAHPNVIAVFDVGVEAGRVFLAMELVEGVDLRDWLEGGHSDREIVDAFVQAARGLAAAHAAGIIHRDFKPSNVLVPDDGGQVRVLDFGLAHPEGASRDSTHSSASHRSSIDLGDAASSSSQSDRLGAPLTKRGFVMGTPAYMSPEQHVGRPTDPRSDQFSFCVALYEALFGTRPFVGRTSEALRRAKLRQRIAPPKRQPSLPGRVRRAVVRGLTLDPERRWPTMLALIAELEAATQRRRGRRALVGVGGLVVVAGLASVAFGSEERRCDRAAGALVGSWDSDRASAIASAFADSGVPYVDDTWSRVEAQLDAYAQRWGTLRVEACELAVSDAAAADRRVTCLQGRLDQLRGLTDVLVRADRQVVERGVQLTLSLDPLDPCTDDEALAASVSPPDATMAGAVAELRRELQRGRSLEIAGKYDEALGVSRHVRDRSVSLGYAPLEVEAMFLEGAALTQTGDLPEAESVFVETLHRAETIGHDAIAARCASRLVFVVGRKQARFDEGLQWARHAESLLPRLEHNERLRASLLNSVGALLEKQGKSAEAEDHHRRALVLWESIGDPVDIAVTRNNLGIALFSLGRFDEAIEQYEAVLGLRIEHLGPKHTDVGVALNNLGNALYELERFDEAERAHQRALAIWREALGPDHPYLAASLNNLGNSAYGREDYDAAADYYEQAIELRKKLVGPDHPDLASTMMNLGAVREGQGRSGEAIQLFERALTILTNSVGADHAWALSCRENIATVLAGQGRYEEAMAHQRAVLEARTRTLPEGHPDIDAAQRALEETEAAAASATDSAGR
jgi:tetratricopeptide (TPR) repeat protein/tRNA A-37 threonylcarbamoyl transferase component Bud32